MLTPPAQVYPPLDHFDLVFQLSLLLVVVIDSVGNEGLLEALILAMTCALTVASTEGEPFWVQVAEPSELLGGRQ